MLVFSNDDAENLEVSPNKCRICLKDGDIPIFGTLDLSKQIMEFGGITLEEDDEFPHHICIACNTWLSAAVSFRETAQKSNSILTIISSTELSDDLNNKDLDENDEGLGTEPYVKREYLEYAYTSDSEMGTNIIKNKKDSQAESINETVSQDSQDNENKNIEMQLLKMKDENGELDPENEMIMIIVSDKNKINESQTTEISCEELYITDETPEKLEEHNLEKQVELHAERKCDVCNKMIHEKDFKKHLIEHRDKYKKKLNTKYGKIQCNICNKKVSKTYYSHHLKMHGSDSEKAERTRECPICMKSVSINYLSNHMKRIHPTSTNKYEKVERNNEKLVTCPVCDKKVKESVFNVHLAKHGGSTKCYVCDQCGKVFKHPSPFKTHCLTHGGELKYQCRFCPYRGLHQALLKIHVRTHTGDYNYKCTECPARFITKSNLSKHIARHNGDYKFYCDICRKGFYIKRDLERHQLNTHSDTKDNVCETCGKGYGHRDTLLNHQLKVHKRKKICQIGRMPSYLKLEQTKNLDDEL